MKFEHTNSYSAPSSQVLAMLTTPEFRERVCEHQQALEHSVKITVGAGGATVVITRTQSMQGAPGIARKMTGDSVQVVQREVWGAGQRADFSMEIPGKPGYLRGTVELRDTGEGSCQEVFTGEVKVNVPLVGGKLEGMVGDMLRRALQSEGRVGAAWLEEH